MTCDLCHRDDKRPHYHAFVNRGTTHTPRIVHLWVCPDCKETLKADVEHRDDG